MASSLQKSINKIAKLTLSTISWPLMKFASQRKTLSRHQKSTLGSHKELIKVC